MGPSEYVGAVGCLMKSHFAHGSRFFLVASLGSPNGRFFGRGLRDNSLTTRHNCILVPQVRAVHAPQPCQYYIFTNLNTPWNRVFHQSSSLSSAFGKLERYSIYLHYILYSLSASRCIMIGKLFYSKANVIPIAAGPTFNLEVQLTPPIQLPPVIPMSQNSSLPARRQGS